MGKDAKGLSAGTISRLKQCWINEYDDWRTRNFSKEHYVYIWADGIYFNIGSDDAKQCILVIIGVTSRGKKEFLAIEDGYRESEQSWTEVLINLKDRGLKSSKLAIGDGALGFWKASDYNSRQAYQRGKYKIGLVYLVCIGAILPLIRVRKFRIDIH